MLLLLLLLLLLLQLDIFSFLLQLKTLEPEEGVNRFSERKIRVQVQG